MNRVKSILSLFVAASTLTVLASQAAASPQISFGLSWGSPAPVYVERQAPVRRVVVERRRAPARRVVVERHRAPARRVVVERHRAPARRVVVEREVHRKVVHPPARRAVNPPGHRVAQQPARRNPGHRG